MTQKEEVRQRIFEAMNDERNYQDERWGSEFDDKNTINDWAAYVNNYMSNATIIGATHEEQKTAFLKAGTLLLAVLERYYDEELTLAPRHYDN